MADKPIILVDLNVVLDVLQNRQPFYEESARVIFKREISNTRVSKSGNAKQVRH